MYAFDRPFDYISPGFKVALRMFFEIFVLIINFFELGFFVSFSVEWKIGFREKYGNLGGGLVFGLVFWLMVDLQGSDYFCLKFGMFTV